MHLATGAAPIFHHCPKSVFFGKGFFIFSSWHLYTNWPLVWVLICKDLRIVCFKLPWIWFICSELKTWKVFCFYEEHTHVFTHSLWATLIFSHSSVSLRILPASARAEMVTKATRKIFNILTTFDQDLWDKTNSRQLPSSCWPEAGDAVQQECKTELTQVRLSQMTFLRMSPREASCEEKLTGQTPPLLQRCCSKGQISSCIRCAWIASYLET